MELKHIVGYLPYKLPIKIRQEEQISREEWKWFEYDNYLNGELIERDLKNITPILRPLSDLTKEIKVNGEKFVPIQKLGSLFKMNIVEYCNLEQNYTLTETIFNQRFCVIEKLYEWHFDIHDLIVKGLAVDINTLKQQ